MSRDMRQVFVGEIVQIPGDERFPEQLEISGRVIAGSVARLRRQSEVRIGHQRQLARAAAQRGKFLVGDGGEVAAQYWRVKGADDGDNSLRFHALRDNL